MENRLLTIPISHYCEKARWALHLAGIPYREDQHLQGFHYLHTARYFTATVPILITANRVIKDSTDILHWTDHWSDENSRTSRRLYPREPALRQTVEKFEEKMDEVFGPAGRLWMYTYAFDFLPLMLESARFHQLPQYERKLMPALFRLIRPFAKRRLKWADDSRLRSREIVDDVFTEVESLLTGEHAFLFGNEMTAADLTFAALAAPAVLPENYGVHLPDLEELPAEMAEQISTWRQRPAGKYALKMYHDHR